MNYMNFFLEYIHLKQYSRYGECIWQWQYFTYAMLSHFHSTSIIFMAHYLSNTHENLSQLFFFCCSLLKKKLLLLPHTYFHIKMEICNKHRKIYFSEAHSLIIIMPYDLPNLLERYPFSSFYF